MISVFTDVWAAVSTYLIGLFSQISAVFYTPGTSGSAGSLTFVGTLAVIMAGISLLLLVFNIIRSFLVARA